MANNIFTEKLRTLFGAATVLCLLAGVPAQAQFAGRAVAPNTPINLPVTPTLDQSILYPARPAFTLMPGDLVNVHVYSVPDYIPIERVALDGTIQLPFAGIVKVEGLSVTEAEQRVASALVAAGIFNNPQVSIQITETPNHVITVVGEVRTPATVPDTNNRRLLDALNVAGGMNPTASHTITILRPSVPQPIVVELGSDPTQSEANNIPVFSGDTIIVSRLSSFYVLGATRSPGVYNLQPNSPTTLIDAISSAGGFLFESKLDQVHIIRTEGTTRKEVKVNFSRILSGKDPDPILESDDVVYVPGSLVRAAIKGGGFGTLIGVASLATVLVLQ